MSTSGFSGIARCHLKPNDSPVNHVEVYDETQDRWTKCKNMTVKRSAIAGVVVSGRDLGREVLQSFQHPSRDEY